MMYELQKSPNFLAPIHPRVVTCVVLHATATHCTEPALRWLTDPQSRVSAHYLVGPEGRIIQMVAEKDIAWHAGRSAYLGREGVNAFSVGIEMVHPNVEGVPWPDEQIEATARLVAGICHRHHVAPIDIVSHAEVALPAGRKTDPEGFPWEYFRTRLKLEAA